MFGNKHYRGLIQITASHRPVLPLELTVLQAEREGVKNFSLFCNHITIIPTIKAILDSPELTLDGFLGPGHVSMVIGTDPYDSSRATSVRVQFSGYDPGVFLGAGDGLVFSSLVVSAATVLVNSSPL